jgi:glycosyltransferase involved in cell wall biosynthesis
VAKKGTAIHNGIDPERFGDATPYSNGRPYVLALGRLTRKKGFDLLLEAMATAGVGPDLDLLLAGEGEERAALESLAGKLGLAERVRFFGRASGPEVTRLLNGCRLLAVPSREEPFGIVALEGLAAGKPVVATGVGGMAEFLSAVSSTTNLVRLVPATVAGLAEGLRAQLSAPPEQAEAARLREFILGRYSWAQVARQYERILAG